MGKTSKMPEIIVNQGENYIITHESVSSLNSKRTTGFERTLSIIFPSLHFPKKMLDQITFLLVFVFCPSFFFIIFYLGAMQITKIISSTE